MSTKITADNGVELEVCHLGIDATNPNPTEPSSIWARLTAEQRAKLAAALAPERAPIVEGRPVHGITVTGYVGDAPINPADCDRTTVYGGECRNFADTEWIRFDSGRRRSPDARDGNTWLIDIAYGSFWMADEKVRNLVPLVPAPAGGPWTRDDLPSPTDVRWERTAETWKWRPNPTTDHVLDAVVAHLNAHHPKAGMEARLDAEATGAEMTAAYAARDAAERKCDELRSLIAGQSANVDAYREQAREAERQLDRREDEATNFAYWAAKRLGCHVDRLDGLTLTEMAERATAAPAVSRADVEEQLRIAYETGSHPVQRIRFATDNMCDLFGIEAEQAADQVEELADQIENAAHQAIQSVVDTLNRIGVPVDMSALVAGVNPDHWRAMARRALAEGGDDK